MSLPDDGVQAPDLRRTLEDTERLGQRLRLLGRGQECPETKQIRSKGLTLLVRHTIREKRFWGGREFSERADGAQCGRHRGHSLNIKFPITISRPKSQKWKYVSAYLTLSSRCIKGGQRETINENNSRGKNNVSEDKDGDAVFPI